MLARPSLAELKKQLRPWQFLYNQLTFDMFQDDATSVTVAKCERGNVLQQWRCGISPDGDKDRFLTLRLPERGAFLSTNTYDGAYWSMQEKVYLVVSGKNFAIIFNFFCL